MPGSVPLSGARERYAQQAAAKSAISRRNSGPQTLLQMGLPPTKAGDAGLQTALPAQEARTACLRLWRSSSKQQYEPSPAASEAEGHLDRNGSVQKGVGMAGDGQENQRPAEPLGNMTARSQVLKQSTKPSRPGTDPYQEQN
jgi:hypothetical protein